MARSVSSIKVSQTVGEVFPQTRWSLVVSAADSAGPALEELCRIYWRPVYGYLRRSGYAEADAEDLTQSFFVHLLKPGGIASAEKAKGRLRSFLLGALKRHLFREKRYQGAAKRGGDAEHVQVATSDFDFQEAEQSYAVHVVEDSSPDQLFDRSWAFDLLAAAHRRLKDDYARNGKVREYELLKAAVTTTSEMRYADAARELGVAASTVRVLAHRLRENFRAVLKNEIGDTVGSRSEIDGELRYLFEVLSI